MSERRTSSSSLGPALRSMALQHYDGTADPPPSLVVSVPTYNNNNNKSDNHQLQHQSITMKSSTTTTTTTTANATTNAIGSTSNPSLQNFNSSNLPSTTTIPTTNTNPSSPVISNLLVDSDDDDTELVIGGNDTNTITIDMIHTLPTFDPNSYVKTDDNNTNIRCYISNLIVPNVKSCCTIRNTSSSLSHVLQTISDFLRVQCIPYKIRCTQTTVAFHCERNSAFATFMGQSLVFVIYLWYEQSSSSKNDSGEGITDTTSKTTNAPTILIEIQRRRGCPLDLQCIRRSLFRDLMNIDNSNNSNDNTTTSTCNKKNITGQSNPICSRQGMIPLELCRSIWFRSHKNNANTTSSFKGNEVDTTATVTSLDDVEEAAASVAVDDDDTKEISSTINTERLEVLSHYAEMLSSTNTVENHRMALECLCQHTDPTVTDVKDSTTVVQAIVCGTNENNNDNATNNIITEIRTNLLRFINMNESEFYDQLDTSIHMLSSTGCAPKNLQALALRVVFTSLNVYLSTIATAETASLSSKLSIEHDEFWYTVLETARNGIVNAKTAPCFAAISMYLIVQLLQSNIVSNESKYMIYHDILCPNNDTSHILNDVQNANDWGKLHHCRLEAISKQFMDIILTSTEIQLQ